MNIGPPGLGGAGVVETGRWSCPGKGAGREPLPSTRVDEVWKGFSAKGTASEDESVGNYQARDPGKRVGGMRGDIEGARQDCLLCGIRLCGDSFTDRCSDDSGTLHTNPQK